MINKTTLIQEIHYAFKDVELQDGIGLWEAKALDDRVAAKQLKKIRAHDEKRDWKNIPVLHLFECASALSFFDAKGMQFHLPQFLLLALGVFDDEVHQLKALGKLQGLEDPDVNYHLLLAVMDADGTVTDKEKLAHYQERFNTLTTLQLQCIIDFLQYQLDEFIVQYQAYAKTIGTVPETVIYDLVYINYQKGIAFWRHQIDLKNNYI